MRDVLERYLRPLREGEGGGGGSGGGQQQQQQQQQPAAWTPPATLPAHLAGADAASTVEKLLGAYLPAREELGRMPKAPDKADAYALTLEGPLAGYSDSLKNDPIMPEARKLAHEAGMSQAQYQKFVAGFINIMHDKGAFAPMPSDAKIAEGLIDATLQGPQRAEALTASAKRLTDTRAWVDGLKDDTSGFSAHERAELGMMVNSPGGVSLVERLMKSAKADTVNPGGRPDPAANSQAEYEKRLQDPRNATDPAYAAETRAMSKRLFSSR